MRFGDNAKKAILTGLGALRWCKNWPTYFADLAGMRDGRSVRYRVRPNAEFLLRGGTADRGILKEVWMWHVYTPSGFEVGERDVVIDIGAQAGVFTVYAATRARMGRVVALEPMGENFRLLLENLKLNRCQNVLPVPKGISGKGGVRTLYTRSNNTGAHSFIANRGETGRVQVETVSLEALLSTYEISRVDFLKMDCEGAEHEVLRETPPAVLGRIRRISMEVDNLGPDASPATARQILSDAGFQVRMVVPLGGVPILYASR